MSLLLRRLLIFIVLLLGGLVLYSLWFGIKADRFDDTAIPYLESAIPELTTWRFDNLEPLLSPAAKLDFANEKMRQAYQSFNRLGKFESMDRPQYVKNSAGSSEALGDFELVEYKLQSQFDTGPAIIEITLFTNGESYSIHHFGFRSDVFSENNPVK